MSNSVKEVENQILEAGKNLIDPPSSVDELLSLLDNLFTCLMDVEQSPTVSMQSALSPLMKALVSGKILKHSDIDVKVAVAACISEITRITAPEAPYDDDQMKEVFKLLVSSFEDLADKSSCSYSKRLSILEAAAKVRSCIVMLDLECYELIIEMFQHFLKAISEHHPGDVFSYMANIMTLVLEESEDIPPEMLSPILHYVKKDAEVSQLSRRLVEQVLSNCASKLKTYLTEAVKSSGVPLDKYSNIVASICEGTSSALQQDQIAVHAKEESQDHLTRETEAGGKQKAAEISTPEQTDAPKDESGKSGVSNDSSDSTKKQDITSGKDEQQQLDNPSNTDVDNTSELKLDAEHQTKEKEKQSSSVEEADSSTNSDIKEETEPVAVPESKDVSTSPPDDSSANAATSSENEKKTSVQALPAKTSADETANVSSPSRGEDVLEQSSPKKTVNQKEKESSTKEEFKPSATSGTEEASEEPNTSEAEVTRKSGRKVASSIKAKPAVPPSKKSTRDTKVAKQSEKKAMGSDNVQEATKIKEEKKKPGRGKAMYEESLHTSSDDNEKRAVSSEKSAAIKSKREAKQPVEENPNADTKRKGSVVKRKASDLENHDENLLGSRIRVWWPMDQAYYKGVISLYVSEKKKHLVCYDDGDQELLNLKRERWYFEDEPESSQLKMESSAKKGGGASSSKSKATPASKSSNKSRKTENKLKDTKKANKEEEEISEESGEEEENPKPVGKSTSSKKKSGKPKDQGVSVTSKASSKKKEEPSKTATASKSKSGPAKSAQPKSKTGKGKTKSGTASTPASKAKDSDVESESEETPKASETVASKGKPGKSQGSQAKSSSKKRKR